jgi:predicted nuclease of restriction endonuclease-like (RecB) superfamily
MINNSLEINDFSKLVSVIEKTHIHFVSQTQKQVNVALTLRNWLIGYYIVEYEQNGRDKAKYGLALIKNIATQLATKNIKGFSEMALRTNRAFYTAYPQIQQTLSVEFQTALNGEISIQQTASVIIEPKQKRRSNDLSTPETDPFLLINKLSFSHFIELLKSDSNTQRVFYEIETIKNNWTVRQLQRAINSMLYQRAQLSENIPTLSNEIIQEDLAVNTFFRSPLVLDFLGLEEKQYYTENDLEEAIINNLQSFLMEVGHGFCFEARQKRITFDNTHYRIDLVFYHRILKCHVLIDLKIGEFSHADSGQMNVYLNYYKENEMQENDNEPVGIILCASKNESLVRYATTGLSQQVFVSKYLVNLPKEEELKKIIREEQYKINQTNLK